MTWWLYLLIGAATWGCVLGARKARGQKPSGWDMVLPLVAWPLLWTAAIAWQVADWSMKRRAP